MDRASTVRTAILYPFGHNIRAPASESRNFYATNLLRKLYNRTHFGATLSQRWHPLCG